MIPKLQDHMNDRRIPMVIKRKNGMMFYQLQIEVAREDRLCAGIFCEYEKAPADDVEEVGRTVKRMISRFHEVSDLTIFEFRELTGFDNVEEYEYYKYNDVLNFYGIKKYDPLDESFESCNIDYDVKNNSYDIHLDWVYREGRKRWLWNSESTGDPNYYTFEEPLGFDDDVDPKRLGEMIMEAFVRGKKMSEVMSRGTGLPKEIDLLDGTVLEITSPKDKHFVDYGDANVGEIFQYYAYIARMGTEPPADLLLTMTPEIYEDLSCENIRSAWIEAFGEADEFEVKEIEYGIYQYRAEFKNKKIYRVAYFRKQEDGTALECCLEIRDPAKRQKLIDKLPEQFEKFATDCKIK